MTPLPRRGFGSRLTESLLAASLNRTVKMTYDPKGVLCESMPIFLANGIAAKISLSWKPGMHFLP